MSKNSNFHSAAREHKRESGFAAVDDAPDARVYACTVLITQAARVNRAGDKRDVNRGASCFLKNDRASSSLRGSACRYQPLTLSATYEEAKCTYRCERRAARPIDTSSMAADGRRSGKRQTTTRIHANDADVGISTRSGKQPRARLLTVEHVDRSFSGGEG